MAFRNITLAVLLLASIILILIELLAAGVILNLGVSPLVAIGFGRAAEIAAMAFILFRGVHEQVSVDLLKNKFIAGFKKGFAWSMGFGLCAFLLLGVLYILDYNILHLLQAPVDKSMKRIVQLLLVGTLISPVAEEIFFRGIVYGYLRRWGVLLAVLGSTALFSMAHALTSGLSFIQIIGGLVFAIAYEMEKNLLVPITIHILGNLAIFTVSMVLGS